MVGTSRRCDGPYPADGPEVHSQAVVVRVVELDGVEEVRQPSLWAAHNGTIIMGSLYRPTAGQRPLLDCTKS